MKVKPPKAGLIPVGEMWESTGPRRRVSMLRGRIMFPSGKLGWYDPGEARGVPSPWVLPKGEWSACAMSKSSGRALDRIMRSRSSLVSRLSFARLQWDQQDLVDEYDGRLPVLEPDLHLSRAEAGNLAG